MAQVVAITEVSQLMAYDKGELVLTLDMVQHPGCNEHEPAGKGERIVPFLFHHFGTDIVGVARPMGCDPVHQLLQLLTTLTVFVR